MGTKSWFIFCVLVLLSCMLFTINASFDDQLDKDDQNFKNSAPAMWDPKALVRVQFPKKNTESIVKDIIEAEKEPTKEPEKKPEEERTYEECYDLDYPQETADDLKATLSEEINSIIVTVWYENYQSVWAQNMLNQNVQGTLYRIICKNHPQVVYSEADLSHYNRYAYTYEKLAKELEVDVPALYHGPTVAIMHDQSGMTFRTEDNPDKLLKVVDEYLHAWEKQLYGSTNPPCDLNDKNLAINPYEVYVPNGKLEMYTPEKDETHHSSTEGKAVAAHQTTTPAPRISLAEPERALN